MTFRAKFQSLKVAIMNGIAKPGFEVSKLNASPRAFAPQVLVTKKIARRSERFVNLKSKMSYPFVPRFFSTSSALFS